MVINREGMQQSHEIVVTRQMLHYAEHVARDLQKAVGLREPWTSLRAYLDAEARLNYVRIVENFLNVDLRGARVLEIGCGMGMFVTVARKLGVDCIGSEPCAGSYGDLRAASEELLQANAIPGDVICQDPGENLPWPEATFDFVVSFQVLEHASHPARLLAEAVRVLKPGGRLFMDVPNHLSLTEGHFGIVWWPPLAWSKLLARFYVTLMGRNSEFLSELNMVTPGRLSKWAAGLDAELAVSGPRRLSDASPSTAGVKFRVRLPENVRIPQAKRFGFAARRVRSLVASRRLQPFLERLGMANHLWLTGRKTDLREHEPHTARRGTPCPA